MRGASDWDFEVRKTPTPAEVAKLAESHGLDVCFERWSYMSERTIGALLAKGRKQRERKAV